MKVLFDTSALIAAFVSAHEQHERALPYLKRALAGEIDMVVSAHTLAELYATLTVLPITPGITSGQAQDLIRDNVLSSAEVVGLDASDYVAVIERMARLGLVSGAIYDALHVRAAERAEADQLVTCNGRDFRRMPPTPPTELIVL